MRHTVVKGIDGNINISKIAMGTTYFGTRIPEEMGYALMDAYVAAGGNTIDTARVYADWLPGGLSASERIVGNWLKTRKNRDRIVLITKGGHPPKLSMHESRMTEENVRYDLNLSLETLGVDYVDIYFLHRDDENVSVEYIVDMMDKIVKDGKAKAIGVSNWRAERIKAANDYAKAAGKTPFTVSEIQWSYVYCTPEMWQDDTLVCMNEDEFKQYEELEIPVMGFSSQAKGFFLKTIANGKESLSDVLKHFICPENDRRLEKLLAASEKTGISPASLSICYITCNQKVDGISLIGCSNLDQLKESMEPADMMVDESVIDFMMEK